MTAPDTGADELLAAVVCGERDENDPDVIALFAREPAARDRLRRMQRLADELEGAGAEQRAVIADRAQAPPSHAQVVRTGVARLHRPRPSRGLLLAAALLGLAGVIAFVSWLPRAARPDDVLGAGSNGAQPVGVVAENGEFRWNLELPRHGWFDLVFLDDSDPVRELFRVPGLTEPHWLPDQAHRALMKDRMAWRVDAIEPGPRIVASAGPFVVRRR